MVSEFGRTFKQKKQFGSQIVCLDWLEKPSKGIGREGGERHIMVFTAWLVRGGTLNDQLLTVGLLQSKAAKG